MSLLFYLPQGNVQLGVNVLVNVERLAEIFLFILFFPLPCLCIPEHFTTYKTISGDRDCHLMNRSFLKVVIDELMN